MSRCLVVQHALAEKPYFVATALARAGVRVEVCQVFAGEPLPASLEGYAGMIVMGGPMSAASDDGFPTRADELALMRDALATQTPTLGICLGAQLLAAAAGAPVYPGDAGPEIGWGPVHVLEEAAGDILFDSVPSRLPVLHWHGDTFDLPAGAVLLASSSLYAHQAFRVGNRAWGLQFHIEVDEEAVEAFVSTLGHEAVAAGVSPSTIAAAAADELAELAPTRYLVLSRFAQLVAGSPSGN
ncbi:MAG TPA: type 1 glutamine amidotransferase [Acidimicrobiales bacterium]|nr:type 1 glutamine amidotransferase [Acidimicrobiales bacterium]